jgi:hypothetical protein
MFWKVIRWGGSAAIILLVIAAIFASSQTPGEHGATPLPGDTGSAPTPVEVTPADSAPPQNKNFNL